MKDTEQIINGRLTELRTLGGLQFKLGLGTYIQNIENSARNFVVGKTYISSNLVFYHNQDNDLYLAVGLRGDKNGWIGIDFAYLNRNLKLLSYEGDAGEVSGSRAMLESAIETLTEGFSSL